MKKSFGKATLGSGNKMSVYLHGYGRSTHNLNKVVRTTMNVGTLIPLYTNIGLNGDTWDIDLNALIKTKPAIAPLFGTYKYQVDVFTADMRLYISALHNNPLNVGMSMDKVKIPIGVFEKPSKPSKLANSSLISYLGVRGIPQKKDNADTDFEINALPILAYYDIFKNYYANKQEDSFMAVLGGTGNETEQYPSVSYWDGIKFIDLENNTGQTFQATLRDVGETFLKVYIQPNPGQILTSFDMYVGDGDVTIPLDQNKTTIYTPEAGPIIAIVTTKFDDGHVEVSCYTQSEGYKGTQMEFNVYYFGEIWVNSTGYQLKQYKLDQIDKMREAALATPFYQTLNISNINGLNLYSNLFAVDTGIYASQSEQNGICVKTFQSDVFQNWLNTEWVDGVNGISEITKVDTSDGLNLDALNIAQKVYNMLNRIAVSGGSWEDWQEAVYGNNALRRAESPVYHGGMSCRIGFEEVTSNASAPDADGDNQPLGTLAGKGQQYGKKGGRVTIHVKEPCVIMVIASITPYIDYSQGNKWFMEEIKTINDLHKPALDGIGFQNLPQYQVLATAKRDINIGKSPAWIHYMTDVNECYGEFAIGGKERYMTLQKEYEQNTNQEITNSTTYIDPTQFNYTFADRSLDAQNFWVQQAFDIKCRRIMSAKVIPNL